jgi:DNA polymerase-3 subunit gamma/tau
VRDSWPEILELVEKEKRSAWIVVFSSQARALAGDVLTLTFPSENDVANFRQPPSSGESVSEYLRRAILDVLGIRVKFIARVEPTMANTPPPARTGGPSQTAAANAAAAAVRPAPAQAAPRSRPASAPQPDTRPQVSAPAAPAAPQATPTASAAPQAGRAQGSAPQERPQQGQQARPEQARPEQAQPQQARPQQGQPQQGQQSRAQQSRPTQSRPAQRDRKLSDIPDSFAPPPDDYVEPIEPDLQSEYEPGGWAVAAIPGGPTPTPKQNEEAEKATKAAKPSLIIDPTAPPTRPFGKGTPPPKLGPGEKQRYGESVVREVLGASFIEEEPVAPRVIPMSRNE